MTLNPTTDLELTPMVMGKIAVEQGIQRAVIGEEDNKLASLIPDLSIKVHLARSDLARCLQRLEVQYGDTFSVTNSAFSSENPGLDAFSVPNVHVHTAGSSFDLGALQEHRQGLSVDKRHNFWIGQALARVDHYAQRSAVIANGTGKEPLKLLKVITGETVPKYQDRNIQGKIYDRFYLDGSLMLEGSNDASARTKDVDQDYTTKANATNTSVTYQYVPFDTDYSQADPNPVYGGLPEAFIRSISNNLYDITAGDEFALRALTRQPFIQELAGFWFDGCRVRNASNARHATNFQYMMSGASYAAGTEIERLTTTSPGTLNTIEQNLGFEPVSDVVNNPWDSPYGATILKNVVQKYFNDDADEMFAFEVSNVGNKTAIRLGPQGLLDKTVTVNLYLVVKASVLKRSGADPVSLISEAIVDGQTLAGNANCQFIPTSEGVGGQDHETTGFDSAAANDNSNWVLRIKLVFDQSSTSDELATFDTTLGNKIADLDAQIATLDTEIAAAQDEVNTATATETAAATAETTAQTNFDADTSSTTLLNLLENAKITHADATQAKQLAQFILDGKNNEKTRTQEMRGKAETLKATIPNRQQLANTLATQIIDKETEYETEISNLT